ncbi:1-aminocyclopropane-1-carboxylate deaminase [Crenothrix sp. D3]|nr:1-aminocyclopropane-1-carboxylate deaminase [Crenothrix sp. D3]
MHSALINLEKTFKPSLLTKVNDALLEKHQVELWIKRDDLLHPIISGNKWRKLKYSLNHALTMDANTVISMGGTYSNHLHALAYIGKVLGLKTVGLIRGEAPATLTPSLLDMQHWGMELRFVSRSDYRLLRQYKQWNSLPNLTTGQYWLPEGGAEALALLGVAELVGEIDKSYDVLCVPCGTGTTLAGLVTAVANNVSVLGFAALKNAGFLTADVNALLPKPYNNWRINLDYHFGGFAKTNAALLDFITDFELKHQMPLEPVYTGKMLYGLYDLVEKQHFQPNQRIITLHTGGLQGKRGVFTSNN